MRFSLHFWLLCIVFGNYINKFSEFILFQGVQNKLVYILLFLCWCTHDFDEYYTSAVEEAGF